jgi:flagellar hook-length control protein FliK
MEQTNMVMAMYQTMAAQGMLPKTGKTGDKSGDFQKLLDQKSQPAKNDAPAQEKPKVDGAAAENEEASVKEDPLEQIKKLAEQGYVISQPSIAAMTLDGKTYEPGEYVIAWKGPDVQFIPVTGLDESQMRQLQELIDPVYEMDVSDPEADALLEATDPTAEHSPAELLEMAVNHQSGKAMEQAVEEAKPQGKDEDAQVELIDVEQGPRQIFHDVKAAPIKVAEAPEMEQPQNVAQQIDAGLAQALQKGESLVRIQLNPENLGEVTVEISQSAQGILKVALTASSADTRHLLERHAGDLQGMLSNRTEQSVEVSVQRQQESQQNQNQQHSYDGHNGHAQDGQERRQRREHTSSQDFMQQLRLGLIPDDGGI